MKALKLSLLLALGGVGCLLADNTFPDSGNVGINTTDPQAGLDVYSYPLLLRSLRNGARGDIWDNEFIRFTGPTSDYIISLQDGTGRVQHYWNSTVGASPTFLVGGEAAGKLAFNPASSGVFSVYYASGSGKLAGDAISWDPVFTVTRDQKLGLGTSSPSGIIDIRDCFYGDIGRISILAQDSSNNGGKLNLFGSGSNTTWAIQNYAGDLRVFKDGLSGMRIDSSGHVGIGVEDPQNKLDVNGTIRAKEIIVASDWADFVFEDDYELMPLAQVHSYIQENKRLPGMPSAEEVQEQGVSLGEMQTVMLQKMEEMTLHMITLQNENQKLKVANAEQLHANAELLKRLEKLEEAMNHESL